MITILPNYKYNTTSNNVLVTDNIAIDCTQFCDIEPRKPVVASTTFYVNRLGNLYDLYTTHSKGKNGGGCWSCKYGIVQNYYTFKYTETRYLDELNPDAMTDIKKYINKLAISTEVITSTAYISTYVSNALKNMTFPFLNETTVTEFWKYRPIICTLPINNWSTTQQYISRGNCNGYDCAFNKNTTTTTPIKITPTHNHTYKVTPITT